jgi:hypothetical protein
LRLERHRDSTRKDEDDITLEAAELRENPVRRRKVAAGR